MNKTYTISLISTTSLLALTGVRLVQVIHCLAYDAPVAAVKPESPGANPENVKMFVLNWNHIDANSFG
jgi:hypothetical protein